MAWGLMNTLISPLSGPVRACRLFSSAVEVSVRWSQVCWRRAVIPVWLSWLPSFPLGLPARREKPWASSQSMILPLIHCQHQESQSYECVYSFWMCELSALVAILSYNTDTSCALRVCSAWVCHSVTVSWPVVLGCLYGKCRFESGPQHPSLLSL